MRNDARGDKSALARDTNPTVQHVAVGVVYNAAGQVLIARRPDHVHQGGLWEFPGGKIVPGEDAYRALQRELDEELDIRATAARPLIRVRHAYAAGRVLLDVWRVRSYTGTPRGREGQSVQWADPVQLRDDEFPPANRPIINAVRLPTLYAVSGEPRDGADEFMDRLERVLRRGVRLVQLRAKSLGEAEYRRLAERAAAVCRRHRAELLLNAPPSWVPDCGAAGVHLTAARLMSLEARPLGGRLWAAASCHTAAEVAHARHIGVDFIVAAPVLPTTSHPGGAILGWSGLRTLADAANMPVYAMGGLTPAQRETAYRHGAQGVAAISSLWDTP